MNTRPVIAFLGLGTMGLGMARNLARSGFSLRAYNRNPQRSAALNASNVTIAKSPGDAAQGADIIIAMVADDEASRSVWLSADGALAAAKPHSVCIESSTLSVDWVKTLAGHAQRKEVHFLDAPVTGSKEQADKGELKFLVGGDYSVLKQIESVFSAMGTSAEHIGPAGSGAILKLVNNFLCGVQVASLAEALALISRNGLNHDRASAVLLNGACGSPLIKTIAGRIAAKNYLANFSVSLLRKDLDYAIAQAASMGLELSTARPARKLFSEAVRAGLGQQDIAAVAELLDTKQNGSR